MNRRRSGTIPAKLRIPPLSAGGPSIGPASTPDIFSQPPPLLSADISTALLRSTSNTGTGRSPSASGKSWDRGEWVGSPTLHVGEGLGGTGAGSFVDERAQAGEEDEDSVVVDEGIEWVGWTLLVGSVLSWTMGVWSMMIAPFIDTSSVPVSRVARRNRRLAVVKMRC